MVDDQYPLKQCKVLQLEAEVRTPKSPPQIAPIAPSPDRPLWSVMIPAYNCISFLAETIRSVLNQDLGVARMQIEVVDDCSSDGDIERLVNEVGKGRVGYFRQPYNRGSLRNFETCINRSLGEYVHLLHGDDLVLPGFYNEMEALLSSYPEAGSAIANYGVLTGETAPLPTGNIQHEKGLINDWLLTVASRRKKVQPPAVVVKRSVYEKLGGFFGVHYGEDWEMWTRIAAHYPVVYTPKFLALYRGAQTLSISGEYLVSGKNVTDLLQVINTNKSYLPKQSVRLVTREAKKNLSHGFARRALQIIKNNALDFSSFYMTMKCSFRLYVDAKVLYFFVNGFFIYLINKLHPLRKD